MIGRKAAALGLSGVLGGVLAVAAPTATASAGTVRRAAVPYDYREIAVPSTGGVKLDGNVFVPRTPGPHPAVVFISSWSLEDHEYIAQAAKLADKGYIVLSYTARGFYGSGGGIDVAGPDDWADGSKAIDWLIAHRDVDARSPIPVERGQSLGVRKRMICGHRLCYGTGTFPRPAPELS